MSKGPIGIFDSGYGGLTVLKELVNTLPEYDYLYLGDNARAPYGSRSYDTVYQYTLECVKWLFSQNCHLVVLACNTASAKALRTIQQKDLPLIAPDKRVLGVIRPTAEIIGEYTKSRVVGVLGTTGTVLSGSYPIEINKLYPDIEVLQQACPIWVPLIENDEYESPSADPFIKKYLEGLLDRSRKIDTILLACTHYPLLIEKIKAFVPEGVKIISQGSIVAASLKDYLHRHPEIEGKCSKNGGIELFTTDSAADFDEKGSKFFGRAVKSKHLRL